MDCKNCQENFGDTVKYCPNCGAKVILDKLTIKTLWNDFATNFLGWDNRYLTTVKKLLLQPEQVLSEYINGTRKKYVAPIAFMAIGTALAMLVFNNFSDRYIELTSSMNEQQFELIQDKLGDIEKLDGIKKEEKKKEFLESNERVQKTTLKYYNIITFCLLPFYAFIAFLIFGRPHNYGEHLIINCYIQGVGYLIGIVFFLVGIFVNPFIYLLVIPITVVYYLYAYGRLNDYKFGTIIIKLLKFLGLFLVIPLLLFLAGFVIGSLS